MASVVEGLGVPDENDLRRHGRAGCGFQGVEMVGKGWREVMAVEVWFGSVPQS